MKTLNKSLIAVILGTVALTGCETTSLMVDTANGQVEVTQLNDMGKDKYYSILNKPTSKLSGKEHMDFGIYGGWMAYTCNKQNPEVFIRWVHKTEKSAWDSAAGVAPVYGATGFAVAQAILNPNMNKGVIGGSAFVGSLVAGGIASKIAESYDFPSTVVIKTPTVEYATAYNYDPATFSTMIKLEPQLLADITKPNQTITVTTYFADGKVDVSYQYKMPQQTANYMQVLNTFCK